MAIQYINRMVAISALIFVLYLGRLYGFLTRIERKKKRNGIERFNCNEVRYSF